MKYLIILVLLGCSSNHRKLNWVGDVYTENGITATIVKGRVLYFCYLSNGEVLSNDNKDDIVRSCEDRIEEIRP